MAKDFLAGQPFNCGAYSRRSVELPRGNPSPSSLSTQRDLGSCGTIATGCGRQRRRQSHLDQVGHNERRHAVLPLQVRSALLATQCPSPSCRFRRPCALLQIALAQHRLTLRFCAGRLACGALWSQAAHAFAHSCGFQGSGDVDATRPARIQAGHSAACAAPAVGLRLDRPSAR